jgi:hypothetical protein
VALDLGHELVCGLREFDFEVGELGDGVGALNPDEQTDDGYG